jgi:hypothetical protein
LRAAWALVVVALVAQRASGAPLRVAVRGSEASCPSVEQLIVALRPLVPDVTLMKEIADAARTIELSDDAGPGYSIRVDALERSFTDPGRDCAERARLAAVFAALALAPPTPPSEPITKPAEPAPARPMWRRLASTIELVGTISRAARAGRELSGGAAVRAAIGVHALSAVVGIGAGNPTSVDLGVGSTTLLRVPIDLGLRGAYRRGRVEVLGDLELALVPMRLAGDGLANAQVGDRLEVGLRIALDLRVWVHGRIAVVGGMEGSVFPKPYTIAVDPVGDLGETPIAWLGGHVGVAVRLR